MPSAAEARSLFREFLRLSRQFGTSYNIKEWVSWFQAGYDAGQQPSYAWLQPPLLMAAVGAVVALRNAGCFSPGTLALTRL